MNDTSQIFVLNGSPKAGKNTFVDMIPYSTTHYSYVDLTRRMLDSEDIYYGIKSESVRVLLETINNALEKYNDIPFKDICSVTDDFLYGYLETDYLFVDIRKPENIKKYIDKYKGARTIFVDDKRPVSNVTESDSLVADYHYDFYIDNSGSLEDLGKEAIKFISMIRGDTV